MKYPHFFILILVVASTNFPSFAQVGINNTNPDPSAELDIQSNSKGVLIPRMSSVDRNNISSPPSGLLVFDATTQSFWFRKADTWIELVDDGNEKWKEQGNNIYYNSGNVGIGTNDPDRLLHSYLNNGTVSTSGFLIEQDGTGDAFMNIGLTGNHHYALGIDQSDQGKFKIGYSPTSPSGVNLGTYFTMRNNGQIGIGTASPTDRLHVDADSLEAPLRVRINGATKLRVLDNGGVTIGQNGSAPIDGLRIRGELRPDGNITTPANLMVESTGTNGFVQIKKGNNNMQVDDMGVFSYAEDQMILETNTQSNKIELNSNGTVVQSNQNIEIFSDNNTTNVTIKANNTLITIDASGGITIDTDGEALTVNSQGGDMTFNSDGGKISFLSGNGDIELNGDDIDLIADRTFDILADEAIKIESLDARMDLKTFGELKLEASGRLFGMSSSDIKLNADLNLDFDANTFDFDPVTSFNLLTNAISINGTDLIDINGSNIIDIDAGTFLFMDAPRIDLNGPAPFGAARINDQTVGAPNSHIIIEGSNSVFIGN